MLGKDFMKKLLSSEQSRNIINGANLLRLDMFSEIKGTIAQISTLEQSIVCGGRGMVLRNLTRLITSYYKIVGYF